MANIGTLRPTRDNRWAGSIFLLAQKIRIKLVPNGNQGNANAPAFRVFTGATDLGALWLHKTKDEKPQDYLSGDVDFPGLPEPISFAVFFSKDGKKAHAAWSRKP
jgi:uncharacterized protein (DUF736 family)